MYGQQDLIKRFKNLGKEYLIQSSYSWDREYYKDFLGTFLQGDQKDWCYFEFLVLQDDICGIHDLILELSEDIADVLNVEIDIK
jgi:hypothetical protein